MSEYAIAILVMVAFVGLAFALVYSPWPKSKKYREQEAIADRHYRDALDAARIDAAAFQAERDAYNSLAMSALRSGGEFVQAKAELTAAKRHAEYQSQQFKSLMPASPLRHPVQIDNS